MQTPTDWTPGAIALGIAATVGVLVALRIRAKAPKPAPASAPASPSRTEELGRQRDALYEQIRALDADTGWREDDRALARHKLVVETAETLRAMQEVAVAPPVTTPPARGGSPWVNAGFGLAAGVFGAALVLGIQDYTKPKQDMSAPMQAPAASGMAANPTSAVAGQRVAVRKAAVDANPNDTAARIAYARALIDAEDVKGAFDQTQKVAETEPDNADARTLQAVILLRIGDVAMATGLLDKVLTTHPDHVEALGYRGAIYLNAGEKLKAIEAWTKVIALDPSQQEAVAPLIEMAKTGKNPFGSGPVTGGAAGNSSADLGTASASPASSAPSAPTASDITGTVTCSVPAPYVFIYLRPSGVDRGPPSAVKKFQNPTFPLEFRIGPGDSPMGGAFPEDGTLTVRIDIDGNPTTHEEGETTVKIEHVKPGQSGIQAAL
jgi:cytochrome c-type biogenesis protein CcmH/NrfG